MRHYRITDELRKEVNGFLGTEYLRVRDLGHELYHLENYDSIARVTPAKAKLLMATLFPERLDDPGFITSHRNEIGDLGRKLHTGVKPPRPFSWGYYMVRREWLPPSLEGWRDEDIMRGNIIRFR